MTKRTVSLYISVIILFGSLWFSSCRSDNEEPEIPVTPRDTAINVSNAFTLLTIDSLKVQQYLDTAKVSDTAKQLITNFYNSRNYQYAWFDEKGLTEHASMLWNLYQDYSDYANGVLRADTTIAYKMNHWLTDSVARIQPAEAQKAELQMTRLFFDYAFAKYIGKLNPSDLQWYIPRRKTDVTGLLDSLLAGKKGGSYDWEPLHPQYRLLKTKLLNYRRYQQAGGWDSIKLGKIKKLIVGDRDTLIRAIKRRLQITGQYPPIDTSNIFTEELKDSIITVQQQFGLKADGVVGTAVIDQLNTPVEKRIQQILINMERMRWLPRQPQGTWILANIPSFRLQVYHNDSVALQMNIVVGTAATKTVIFSDDLKNIVFSPYWNVPPSIVRNEILPAIKKNPNYLKRSHMEQTGTSGGLPVVRQLPGAHNALGRVKFLFPNNYNIYLHDTPAKSFFEQTDRAFSHGCVRVGKPFELAKYLLRNDSAWTDKTIQTAMNGTKEKWVSVRKTVPVFLTYFTSWVDNHGNLQFRKDIYGHDQRMGSHLFTEQKAPR